MMIKTGFFLTILICFFYTATGQNLVPNPSFEKARDLPVPNLKINNFEFERKSGNKAFNNHLNYWFSASQTTPDLRILTDNYQGRCEGKYDFCPLAKSGKHAAGIVTFLSNEQTDTYREYLTVKLKKPLQANVKTYISFWVIQDRNAKLVSNNLGCYFSMKKVSAPILTPIKVQPHTNQSDLIYSPAGEWMFTEQSFTPEKAFQYLTIGNFFDNENTLVQKVEPFTGNRYKVANAYYMIDDIKVWQEGDEQPTIEIKEAIVTGKKMIMNHITFTTNSAALEQSSYNSLDEVVTFLQQNKSTHISIYGHTDDIGTESDNLTLSNRRAQIIYEYFISKDIATHRISYEGKGESMPIESGTSALIRAKNRRVEFEITEIK